MASSMVSQNAAFSLLVWNNDDQQKTKPGRFTIENRIGCM